MSDIWFISDIHAYHKNLLSFKDKNGNFMRPEFAPSDPNNPQEVSKCLHEYHNTIIENVNKCVRQGHKLYNLGDVTFFTRDDFFSNWYKKINTVQHRLLLGNHDDAVVLGQMEIFKKIQLWKYFKNEDFTASHFPLDPRNNKGTISVHGHTHAHNMLNADGTEDLKYINVCVEKTNYFPVNLDDLAKLVRIRKEKMLENPNLYPVRDVC